MLNPISILIVDDNDVVRKGVRAYFETLPDFDVVGEAASREDAMMLVSELIPDIVLLELIMSGKDGVETTRHLKYISPRTHIIVLVSYQEAADILSVIMAGASAYVSKELKMEQFAEMLRRVIQGDIRLHPHIAVSVLQNFYDKEGGEPPLFIELTDRELDVLKYIANGLTNNQIAEKLIVSETAVKGYIRNILSKLYLADRAQVAVFSWEESL